MQRSLDSGDEIVLRHLKIFTLIFAVESVLGLVLAAFSGISDPNRGIWFWLLLPLFQFFVAGIAAFVLHVGFVELWLRSCQVGLFTH
jgi:hypothetical protein